MAREGAGKCLGCLNPCLKRLPGSKEAQPGKDSQWDRTGTNQTSAEYSGETRRGAGSSNFFFFENFNVIPFLLKK